MARRWPVLHLANEKSVPFDVAPARASGGSRFSTVSLHRARSPSSCAQASPSCPLLCICHEIEPFSSILRGTFFFSLNGHSTVSYHQWIYIAGFSTLAILVAMRRNLSFSFSFFFLSTLHYADYRKGYTSLNTPSIIFRLGENH